MNKTVSITIGGIIFHVEEDAYEELKSYLDAIKDYFLSSGEGEEIMADIEMSIADKFTEKLGKSRQVITKKEVQELISVMGKVEDFIDEDKLGGTRSEAESKNEKERGQGSKTEEDIPKKLYRNPDDLVIAGVCSGIAAYFGIDPVIVRVVFAASIFAGGTGILVYFLLWIAMPEAKTGTQKLEMHGKPVTLEKIKKAAEEKVAPTMRNAGSRAGKILAFPFRVLEQVFRALGKIFRALGPILRWLIGLPVIFASLLGLFILSLLAAIVLFNLDSPLIQTGFPLNELSQLFPFSWAVITLWFSVIIPIIFIMLLGLVIVSRKNVFNAILNSSLIGIWMIALIAFIVISIDAAPRIEQKIQDSEYGETISRVYDFKDFDKIYITDNHELNITQGDYYSVTAVGTNRNLDHLDLKAKDKELYLENKSETGICLFCYFDSVKFEVTVPDLNLINARESSEVTVSKFSGDRMELYLIGASRAYVNGDYKEYFIKLNGSSDAEVKASTTDLTAKITNLSELAFSGQGETINAEIDGVSKLKAYNYSVERAVVELKGASKAELNVSEQLSADISEASKIYYLGEPTIIKNESGASTIEGIKNLEDGNIKIMFDGDGDNNEVDIKELQDREVRIKVIEN